MGEAAEHRLHSLDIAVRRADSAGHGVLRPIPRPDICVETKVEGKNRIGLGRGRREQRPGTKGGRGGGGWGIVSANELLRFFFFFAWGPRR